MGTDKVRMAIEFSGRLSVGCSRAPMPDGIGLMPAAYLIGVGVDDFERVRGAC